MGNTQYKRQHQYQKQYTIISKSSNNLQILIRNKKTSKQYMLRNIISKTQQQIQEIFNLLTKRKKIKCQHLLTVVDFKILENQKICGRNKYIELLIQYPFQNLQSYMQRRKNGRNNTARSNCTKLPEYFLQHQLWSILYSCCQGLQVLYLSDLTHQSITKNCIFIDKDGVVKIGDPILLGLQKNYTKIIQIIEAEKRRLQIQNNKEGSKTNRYNNNSKNNSNQSISQHFIIQNINNNKNNPQTKKQLKKLKHISKFKKNKNQLDLNVQQQYILSNSNGNLIISPQLISLIKDHQYYFFDKQKSDIFILGAIIIELCYLQNLCSFNIRENMFKKDFKEHLNNKTTQSRYSQNFISLLQQMTNIDPKQRPNLSQIVQKIQQYSIQQNIKTQEHDNSDSYKNSNVVVDYNNFNINQYPSSNTKNYFLKQNITKPQIKSQYYCNNQSNQQSIFSSINVNVNPLNSYNNVNLNRNISFSNSNNGNFNNNINTNKLTVPLQLFENNNNKNYFQESAVKSIYNNGGSNVPIEIKHTYSPYIPLTNVNINNLNQINNKYSTPYNQLFLQTPLPAQQSIVQGKLNLQNKSNNISNIHNLNNILNGNNNNIKNKKYLTIQEQQLNVDIQRFSLNNFGKIQLPKQESFAKNINIENSSLQTSVMPTPRFQGNVNNGQVNVGINGMNVMTRTFQYLANYSNNNQNQSYHILDKNNKVNSIINNNNNRIPTSYTSILSINSLKNPTPNNLSSVIIQPIQQQPYFSNSTVGYTLPKYGNSRPVSQQSIASHLSKKQIKQSKQTHQINLEKKQKKELQLNQHNNNNQSAINEIRNQINKQDTKQNYLYQKINNKSNSSSGKKDSGRVKDSGRKISQKKYNFYKNQHSQQLQKVSSSVSEKKIPYQIQSINLLYPQTNPNITSLSSVLISSTSNLKPQQKSQNSLKNSNLITQLAFHPQFHSKYVEQTQIGGCLYHGFMVNNKKHGHGKLYFVDGGFYEGNFNQNMMEGQGKLYYNNKDLAYQGQFFQNNFHGYGILYNDKPKNLTKKFDFANLNQIGDYWQIFKGHFKDDQKAGKCHIYLTNGQEFQGYCHSNTIEGNGRFKTLDGQYIDGIWKNNVLIEIKGESKVYNILQNQN